LFLCIDNSTNIKKTPNADHFQLNCKPGKNKKIVMR
jgi:hypothetical protein